MASIQCAEVPRIFWGVWERERTILGTSILENTLIYSWKIIFYNNNNQKKNWGRGQFSGRVGTLNKYIFLSGLTSRSASDPDYDISTEDSPENGNENTYTEASPDNSSSDPETESNAKSEARRSSTKPKTKPKPIWTGWSCHPVELKIIVELLLMDHGGEKLRDLKSSKWLVITTTE